MGQTKANVNLDGLDINAEMKNFIVLSNPFFNKTYC